MPVFKGCLVGVDHPDQRTDAENDSHNQGSRRYWFFIPVTHRHNPPSRRLIYQRYAQRGTAVDSLSKTTNALIWSQRGLPQPSNEGRRIGGDRPGGARCAVAITWDVDCDSGLNNYNRDNADTLVASQSQTRYDPLIAVPLPVARSSEKRLGISLGRSGLGC